MLVAYLFGFVAHVQEESIQFISVDDTIMIAIQSHKGPVQLCCFVFPGKALLQNTAIWLSRLLDRSSVKHL